MPSKWRHTSGSTLTFVFSVGIPLRLEVLNYTGSQLEMHWNDTHCYESSGRSGVPREDTQIPDFTCRSVLTCSQRQEEISSTITTSGSSESLLNSPGDCTSLGSAAELSRPRLHDAIRDPSHWNRTLNFVCNPHETREAFRSVGCKCFLGLK